MTELSTPDPTPADLSTSDLADLPGAEDEKQPWWRGPRLKLLIGLAIVAGALIWVAVRGLGGNFVYYLTPTDVVSAHKAHVGERVRLGGYVVPDSVGHTASNLTFTVSDGTDTIKVVDSGSVPELFKAGQGVVLEGTLGSDGAFHSDTLLIKHSGDYRPPAPGQKPPDSADLSSGG